MGVSLKNHEEVYFEIELEYNYALIEIKRT
jgi:hypothetical protein